MKILCALHLLLRQPEAGLFLDRWAPQAVVGNLVSSTSIREYVQAKLHLHKGVGVLVQEGELHAFVVSETEDERGYVVQTCLWADRDADRAASFSKLLEWGDAHNVTLLPGPLMGPLV